MSARFALAVALLGLASFGWSALASAADPPPDPPPHYQVEVCTDNAPEGTDAQSTFEESLDENGKGKGHGPMFFTPCAVGTPPALRQGTPGGIVPEGGGHFWTLVAPAGTTIHTLETEQSFRHGPGQPPPVSFLDWTLSTGRGVLLFSVHDDGRNGGALPAPSHPKYTIDSGTVFGRLVCPHFVAETCPGGEFEAVLRNIVVDLEDLEAPRLSGPAVAAGPVRGVTNVAYSASAGPGIASAALIVDGVEQPAVADSNDGKCQQPYKSFTPCRAFVSSTLPLDTRGLAEGSHEVAVVVVDAAGRSTKSAPVTFAVRNAPIATARPVVAGLAEVGGHLTASTGNWAGDPTGFAYQWFRCPASVTAAVDAADCRSIPGAAKQEYAPTDADLNRRDLVEVTATSAKGSGSVLSEPSELIDSPIVERESKPVLTHVSLSRKRFQIAKGPSANKRGSILRFACSKAGRLSIVIDRTTRRGKRPKRVGVLAAAIKAGPSAVLLNGEIGRKRLRPGRYKLTITVRDAAGNVSDPATLPFTVLRG